MACPTAISTALFTRDKPVIFAYHGYPYLIHRLTYRRTNHAGIHVRGFSEEGTTTTPFDMVVLNQLDRFHLAVEAIERVPGLDIAPPTSSRSSATRSSSIRATCASMARTCRTFATGSGRTAPLPRASFC